MRKIVKKRIKSELLIPYVVNKVFLKQTTDFKISYPIYFGFIKYIFRKLNLKKNFYLDFDFLDFLNS